MKSKTTRDNPFETDVDRELEAQQIEEITDLTVQLMKRRYDEQGQPALRGVHPKSHGCVKARFDVLDDVPEQLQHGLFSKPASYEAVVRYSNAAALVGPDLSNGKNGSRGMAIKVFLDKGRFLYRHRDQKTQDFLMINTPSFAFVNAGDYLKLTKILMKFNDVPDAFFAPLQTAQTDPPTDPAEQAALQRVMQSFKVLKLIQSQPVANPTEVSYFSAAPFLYGSDHCAHFSVHPQGEKKEQVLPENPSENYLKEALQQTISGTGDIVFDFQAQVRGAGEDDLFIEDATQSWDETKFPPQTVARLTISRPQPDLNDPAHLAECEQLFYTPWHALEEHQPLGSINRLRRAVYLASSQHRLPKAAGGCQ